MPIPVGDLKTFWQRVKETAGPSSALVGFDFPIGIPVAYARRAGLNRFLDAIALFGMEGWEDFYRVCERADEINVRRPFYPFRPGGTKRSHLMNGLRLEGHEFLRRCEQANAARAAASPLFWTLGGKQVGKAAIIGWRDLIAPVLRSREFKVRLWPFDGRLDEITATESIVIAETYPAEACLHLGLTPPGTAWSKTSQQGRAAQAGKLLEWANRRDVGLCPSLKEAIRDGFGERRDAEDPFDAMIGLFSMLEVASGFRDEGCPDDLVTRNVEGWILGQNGS